MSAQTTSQNPAKHVACDLCSTQPRLARGHWPDSLSGKDSETLEDNGLVVTEKTFSALDYISYRT